MNVLQTLPVASRALLRNKTRSFLTTLGVVIGVASVISMVAIGEGAKSQVEDAFNAMGTNLLIVMSGSTSSGGVFGGMGSMPTLSWDDLDAIKQEAPAVRAVAPLLTTKLSLIADDANWNTQVGGTTPDYFEIRNWPVERGSMFTESDIEGNSKVLVIGHTVADHLFGAGIDPVGRTIRMQSIPFLVQGVLAKKGQSPVGQDYDDAVYIPYTTFQTKIKGGLQKYIAGVLFVGAKSSDDTPRAQTEIQALLRDRHHLDNGVDDDFQIRNLTEIANAQQEGTNTFTSLLAAIAAVSLLVGGIGIMNIMLVSVTERTREIGVRMAVGAKPWHILAQFLVEAVTLSVAGGVAGVALGMVAAGALADKLGWPLVVRPDIVVVSVLFSGLVGVAFGLYPARKASRLDPIDALRYE
ncbi:MAG TPA: ABC transporter permease [Polyangiaceae bacterium]|jgi:putative ABC transport system permease protein|nr:ABC transporter permease [Polyangiaceae bacterium]